MGFILDFIAMRGAGITQTGIKRCAKSYARMVMCIPSVSFLLVMNSCKGFNNHFRNWLFRISFSVKIYSQIKLYIFCYPEDN